MNVGDKLVGLAGVVAELGAAVTVQIDVGCLAKVALTVTEVLELKVSKRDRAGK